MANKKFSDYVVAGDNITLTYDNNADTVTIDAAGNVDSVNGKVGVVVLTKTDIGLGNVDNTSDANKPISTATQTALNGKQDVLGYTPENVANKGVNNGYAGLDSTGKVPSTQLPSYVDDVVEVANFAALPVVGETGKIYITLDTNNVYRWSGSVYVQISQPNAVWGSITGTLSNQTDLQNAFNGKENTITAGTTSQYYRGDKTFQTLDKTSVGLGNVANVDTTNASNISSGTLSDSRLSINVTTQGNTFNAANKLVQLDGTAKLPAVDGSQLTNLPTPTLAQVTSAGNTTTNAISVGGLTVANYNTSNSQVKIGSFELQSYSLNNSWLGDNVYYNGTTFVARQTGTTGMFYFYQNEGQFRLSASVSAGTSVGVNNNTQLKINSDGTLAIGNSITTTPGVYTNAKFMVIGSTGNVLINTTTDAGYKLDVNGTLRVSGQATFANTLNVNYINMQNTGAYNAEYFAIAGTGGRFNNQGLVLGTSGLSANAILQCDSTTKGVLFPRMTTTQKNAIATPVAGLVVYDTTLGKLCVRGTSAWETITSI